MRPKPSVLADAKKMNDNADPYSALYTMLVGCTKALASDSGEQINDKLQLKTLLRKTPFQSVNFLITEILILDSDDDGVEGAYTCPYCGNIVHAKYVPGSDDDEPQFDTRDFLSDCPVHYMEDYTNEIHIELSKPVNIVNASTDEVIESIQSFVMRYPTINDCIQAYNMRGASDEMRLQMQIYANALLKINNNDVDAKWRRRFGMFLFENFHKPKQDYGKISKQLNAYGRDTAIIKHCNKCQSDFKTELNTSNFFVSALRQ